MTALRMEEFVGWADRRKGAYLPGPSAAADEVPGAPDLGSRSLRMTASVLYLMMTGFD